MKWVEKWVEEKSKPLENAVFSRGLGGDSSGIRTGFLNQFYRIVHKNIFICIT